jgi:hypothetical protein
MKKLHIAIACLLLMAGLTYGQNSITFSDTGLYGGDNVHGTFNPTTTFNLDTSATFTGFTGRGLSYWIEVPTALAPFITITGETYFTWTDDNQTFFGSDVFNDAAGADSGFLGESRDLGATSVFGGSPPAYQQDKAAGTYKVSTLNFALSGAPAGTYTLQLETLTPRRSEINEADSNGTAHYVTTSTYTITVVPEPATWSLIGLSGLGAVALTSLRARRRS